MGEQRMEAVAVAAVGSGSWRWGSAVHASRGGVSAGFVPWWPGCCRAQGSLDMEAAWPGCASQEEEGDCSGDLFR